MLLRVIRSLTVSPVVAALLKLKAAAHVYVFYGLYHVQLMWSLYIFLSEGFADINLYEGSFQIYYKAYVSAQTYLTICL